jgi:hypothetical protein
MAALYCVAHHAQEPLAAQRLQAQLEVQLELDSAGVGGVAGGPGAKAPACARGLRWRPAAAARGARAPAPRPLCCAGRLAPRLSRWPRRLPAAPSAQRCGAAIPQRRRSRRASLTWTTCWRRRRRRAPSWWAAGRLVWVLVWVLGWVLGWVLAGWLEAGARPARWRLAAGAGWLGRGKSVLALALALALGALAPRGGSSACPAACAPTLPHTPTRRCRRCAARMPR